MIGSSDGKQYESDLDVALGKPIEKDQSRVPQGSKPIPTQLPSQFPDQAPLSGQFNIDRTKDVPLAASALHKGGQFYGIAVDKDAPINSMGIQGWDTSYGVYLHEKTEFDHMSNLMATGMEPTEAYRKAHDEIATPIETAYVRAIAAKNGKDPDQFMDEYKQHWRNVAKVAGEKENPDRHPDAHTTTFGLDESELGKKFSDGLMHLREFLDPTGRKQEEPPTPLLYDVGQALGLGLIAMGGKMGTEGLPRTYKGPEAQWKTIPERVEAAKKLGFDQPTFHGGHDEFEGTALKTHDMNEKPFYSTSSPDLANLYAGAGKGQTVPYNANNVTPLVLRTENYHEVDAGGATWAGKGLDTIGKGIDEALANGKDGVIVRNIHDEPSGSSKELPPKDIFITLKGNTARSWFAKFDPANMHLNDLLASGLAVAVPAGTVMSDKDK